MSENADTKPIPKTYYEWLLLLNELRLKVGPCEAFKDERFNHALKPGTLGNVSYGMWDHKTNTGYISWEKLESIGKPKPIEVTPAPPIKDGNKEWD
jgi:hypothetical protein